MMSRLARMLVLGAMAVSCLHCSDDMGSKTRALRVDNANTAASLGVRVGDTIALSCLSGARAAGWHQFTSCTCEHVHGDVTFQNRTAGDTDSFLCGHGCIVSLSSPKFDC